MKTITSLASALVLGMGAGLMAQPGPPPHGMEARGPATFALYRSLGLTEAQQKTIQGLLEKQRQARKALMQASGAKERALREAVQDPAVPESRIRALDAEAAKLRLEGLLKEHAQLQEIQAVLTPEQRKALREKVKREMEARQGTLDEDGMEGLPCPGMPPRP